MNDHATLNNTARLRAKRYSGQIAWPTIVLGLAVPCAYWAIPYLVSFKNFSLWLAIPAMVVLTYAAYTVLHESVHGNIKGVHKSLGWLNDGLGYLAATALSIPLTAHRLVHLTHHGNTNHNDKDPDQYATKIATSPTDMLASAWGAIATQYRIYWSDYWHGASSTQNTVFAIEIVANVLLRFCPFMVLLNTENQTLINGWWRILVLFVGAGLLGTVVLVYLFAYIVHRPHTVTGRYLDTSTIVIKGPLSNLLTVLWGYQNYHSIHHLFPKVPFYNYRRVFNDIQGIMEAMNAPVYELTRRGLNKAKV